jgi:sugar lactone lactonase YvrE
MAAAAVLAFLAIALTPAGELRPPLALATDDEGFDSPRYEAAFYPVERPAGLAVGPGGEVYVVDSALGRVNVFRADGTLLDTVGTPAVETNARPGQLVAPLGVAVDDAGRLYVSDTAARSISVFDGEGRFLRLFAAGQLAERIPGTLFHDRGRLFVADLASHQVLAFDMAGRLQGAFGASGADGQSTLRYPSGVWVDRAGSVFVSDAHGNRVVQFSADGTLARVIAAPLSSPRGLTGDTSGRIYVASALDHRVVALDPDGSVAFTLELAGERALGFPTGLAVRGELLFATDRAAQAVHAWQLPR